MVVILVRECSNGNSSNSGFRVWGLLEQAYPHAWDVGFRLGFGSSVFRPTCNCKAQLLGTASDSTAHPRVWV